MEKARAIQVLSVLAQGVNPTTGECLPEDGPYNMPETIRAIHMAMDSLCKLVTESPHASLMYEEVASLRRSSGEEEGLRQRRRQAWAEEYPEMDEKQLRLFEHLKKWRNEQAKLENVPGYLVFSNATLSRVAHDYPVTLDMLEKIKGIGEVKMERYSDTLLDLVNGFLDVEETKSVGASRIPHLVAG